MGRKRERNRERERKRKTDHCRIKSQERGSKKSRVDPSQQVEPAEGKEKPFSRVKLIPSPTLEFKLEPES